MKIYQLAREYYPFASAGGLKEVVTGLAESYAKLGHESSVFIPCYGFIDKGILQLKTSFSVKIKNENVDFNIYYKKYNNVNIYFIDFFLVETKKSVYTYTTDDEKIDKLYKHGEGFKDTDEINIYFQLGFLQYVSDNLSPPDILNLHDGHTGLIPVMIKSNKYFNDTFINTKIFFTIHNAGMAYHQRTFAPNIEKYKLIDKELLCDGCFNGNVDPLCLAVLHSYPLTVSPFYAEEIISLKHDLTSDNFGDFCNKNNVQIVGITNGVKLDHYKNIGVKRIPTRSKKSKTRKLVLKIINNQKKLKIWGYPLLNKKKPVFLFQNRITEQKGIDKFIDSFKEVISLGFESNFIVMGQGEDKYEQHLISLAKEYPENLCYIQGYEEIIALNLFIVSDFFILTSLWEPCGLTDFEAQLAGSIPIVHKTGGLQKVENEKTGFVYDDFSSLKNLIINCEKMYFNSPRLVKNMKKNAYKNIVDNYTWDKVAINSYIPLFLEKYE